MVEYSLLQNIILTLSFVFGILFGEISASKIFGAPKKLLIQIGEIVVFIVVVLVIFNFIFIEQENFPLVLTIYFSVSFIIIFFLRGITTLLGKVSIRIAKVEDKKREENVVDFVRSLARRGYTEEEIEDVLIESGFKRSKIKKVITMPIERQGKLPLIKRIKRQRRKIKRKIKRRRKVKRRKTKKKRRRR